MALYFKCPKCGEFIIDQQGENTIDYEKGLYRCPECGATMSVDSDSVEYDYELFNMNYLTSDYE